MKIGNVFQMECKLLDIAGHDDSIFLNLTNREKKEFTCCICRFILNDPQQCSNGHVFCLSCITEWSRRGNHTCPICLVQPFYIENYELKTKIESKYVRCETTLCHWKGRLERLNHHINEAHSSSTGSTISTERESPTLDDRIEFHESAKDIDKIHHWKKEVLLQRIQKLEKRKRNDVPKRESALTLPLVGTTSRSTFRPLTDDSRRKRSEKLPHIQWKQSISNREPFYLKQKDKDNVKQTTRESAFKKIDQIEIRKQKEKENIYQKIQDIERRREENKYISEQRILQIERKMKEDKDAFDKRLLEKERKYKEEHLTLQRHISVIKVKMKK